MPILSSYNHNNSRKYLVFILEVETSAFDLKKNKYIKRV